MKRVSVQKYPKGGQNVSFSSTFLFTEEDHVGQLECQLGILECWKGKKSPDIPHLMRSLRQTEYPKSTLSF